MPQLASVLLIIALLVGVATSESTRAADETWARGIVATANSWREGQPIPADLQVYRHSPGDLPISSDSEVLIDGITNIPFLAALATDLHADPRCREDAYAQGLYVGGPTKFFGVLTRDLDVGGEPHVSWLTELRTRAAQRHVVVNALFINDSDMPRAAAVRALDRIQRDLQGGANWNAVYENYADEFRDRVGPRTKIGNLGHLVVYPDPALGGGYFEIAPDGVTWKGKDLPRRLSRLAFFDAAHLSSIMSASSGDVIRLHSSLYSQFVLYQVEEVYPGAH